MKLERIRSFVQELDRKKFYYALGGFLAFFSLLIAGLIFYQNKKITNLTQRIKRVNSLRQEVKALIAQHGLVKQQQMAVDAILEKDANFKIAQYFESLVKELKATKNLEPSSNPITENSLNNGYTEKQLERSFKDMDMKQVTDLLYAIEKNDRVYTKELKLAKDPKTGKLHVSLTIATLEPQQIS